MLKRNLRYQRAYLDFFEDELVRMDYDWKKVVAQYMLVGSEPLIHGAIGGCKLKSPGSVGTKSLTEQWDTH